MTPLKVSIMGTSFAILLIINTFSPTGGVIKPTSTTTKVKIPNQIAVSSGDNPKSSDITKGKKLELLTISLLSCPLNNLTEDIKS